ncbi:MAG TPA: ribonuclease P protein component [Acidimicrobiales bacterium]|nr:ribonuclease P protein component [Acidimicrobiales bacterium]
MRWQPLGRSGFAELRSARAARSGPLVVSWVPKEGPPRLAFAISKRVGTAVARNRLRRQLREAARHHLGLPGGIYLIRAAPTAASADFSALQHHLGRAVSFLIAGEGHSTVMNPMGPDRR